MKKDSSMVNLCSERNDVLIWTIRSRKTGYVYYEDEAQVFAEPFDDVRLMCRR